MTAMMIAAEARARGVGDVLFPFEAGMLDNEGFNQTCSAIASECEVLGAIRREKTAGWLYEGNSILVVEFGLHSLSEEDRQAIQHNPLWMREIELARAQNSMS